MAIELLIGIWRCNRNNIVLYGYTSDASVRCHVDRFNQLDILWIAKICDVHTVLNGTGHEQSLRLGIVYNNFCSTSRCWVGVETCDVIQFDIFCWCNHGSVLVLNVNSEEG